MLCWHPGGLFRLVDDIQDQGDDNAQQYAGGHRNKQLEVAAIYDDVARQLPGPRQTRCKMNEESGYDQDDARDYQKFSHLQKY